MSSTYKTQIIFAFYFFGQNILNNVDNLLLNYQTIKLLNYQISNND